MIEWVRRVLPYKGSNIEANIDSVGEPAAYPDLIDLVAGLRKLKDISRISMQTSGATLTETKIRQLEDAGLDKINLSINSLDPGQAKILSGNHGYDIGRIKALAEFIAKTGIKLLIAPVWIPRVNDDQIPQLIKFSKDIGAELGLQKYEIYNYSRKMKGARKINWWKFYNQLKKWESEFNIKLVKESLDVHVEKRQEIPTVFEKNEKVYVIVRCPGWFYNQMIGVAKDRCISVNDCSAKLNDKIRVKIIETKNNIYLAEKC
jgi:uncharacterized protein